jgi:hypothetical protein
MRAVNISYRRDGLIIIAEVIVLLVLGQLRRIFGLVRFIGRVVLPRNRNYVKISNKRANPRGMNERTTIDCSSWCLVDGSFLRSFPALLLCGDPLRD